MTTEQELIWNYLRSNAQGYGNRKSSTEIRDNCGLPAGDATNVYVRNLITEMIIYYGCCIGSLMWESGYWIIQNEEELNRVCESLESRASSIYSRAESLRKNWNNSIE